MSTTRRPSLALLSVLLLAPQPRTAHAFAEWTKCWTELEEGEVIMNQKVRRQDVVPSGGDDGGACSSGSDGGGVMVRLVVMDTNGRPVKTRRIRKANIPAEDNLPNDHVPNDGLDEANRFGVHEEVIPYFPGQTFHLKLEYASASLPNDDDDDVCTSTSRSADPNDIAPALPANTQYLAQSTTGARFLGRNAMCDGARAVGRKRDDVVRIRLTGDEQEEMETVIRVWAGYASEKAAVLLTPELVFRRDDASSSSSSSSTTDGESDRIRASSSPNRSPHPTPAPAPAPAPSISKSAQPPVHLAPPAL